MISNLFKSLQNEKQNYLNAKRGQEFEERILSYLKINLGFTRIRREDLSGKEWAEVQNHVKNKFGTEFLDLPNSNLKRTFIYQPYGSQQFPDILVFSENKVIPLEIKFSSKKQTKPIWNSNVPRANAFYIFGSYEVGDITFFCGDDIVSRDHRQELYGFFGNIRKLQDKIRKTMPKLDITNWGFTPYIRAAFDQRKHKKEVVTNFFTHPNRTKIEATAIEKISLL